MVLLISAFIAVKPQKKSLKLSKFSLNLKENLLIIWLLIKKLNRNEFKKIKKVSKQKKRIKKMFLKEKSFKKKRLEHSRTNILIKDWKKSKSKNESYLTLDLNQSDNTWWTMLSPFLLKGWLRFVKIYQTILLTF